MNTTIKLGVAGALAFGAVAAHASIANPSSGSSDAILFAEVVAANGTSAVASYAGDTGVSVNTLIAGLTGTQTVLGTDANLQKLFAAYTAGLSSGDTLEWAVEGGQYTGNNNTTTFKVPGAAQFVTTTTGNSTSKLALDNTANLTHWAGLSGDVSQVNTNSGGANTVEGGAPATAGVWDYNNPSTGTSGWYGNGPVTGNLYDGSTAENLYYVTGGGSTAAKVSSTLEGTATLTQAGLVLSGTTPPLTTPIPAAVWLLGSGLLGLTGVARRKLKV